MKLKNSMFGGYLDQEDREEFTGAGCGGDDRSGAEVRPLNCSREAQCGSARHRQPWLQRHQAVTGYLPLYPTILTQVSGEELKLFN
jgi:hypothetical protein